MQWDTQPVYMEELGDLPSQFQTFPTEWNTLHFGLAVDISGTEGAFLISTVAELQWNYWVLAPEYFELWAMSLLGLLVL